MIRDRLEEDMKVALKAGEKDRLSVIRMLRGELKNARIAAGDDLSEAEEQKVLAAYAKKRKESIEQYTELGREDLAAKEQFEYDLTMSYLPAPLSGSELAELIRAKMDEMGATEPKHFGRVMKAVLDAAGSRADGATVSQLVKKALGG